MGVYIKGMEMPKDCPLCPLAHYNALQEFTGCEITRWYFDSETMATSTRPSFCPLVEIPTPHGRLIDGGFEEMHYTSMTTNPTPDVTEQDKANSLAIVRALQMAHTILEAEE